MNFPRIAQLMRDNASRPRSFKVDAKGDEATIYIYDVIGFDFWSGGGVTAKDFADQLDKITAKVVHLRINSPGGDVFEARAMVAAMDRHSAKFVAHVDGIAASAASFLAASADEVEMAEGSMQMIHNAWTIAIGDRNDMTRTADLLAKIDGTIADDYVKKTGKARDEIVLMMDEETWFTAEEAVEAGLADRVAGKVDAKAKNTWDLSAYNHAPKPEPAPSADDTAKQHFATLERRFALLERTAA